MSWWQKVLKVVVPLGGLAANIFVKNPNNKQIVESVKVIVEKIPTD